jgi:hypothetical protein
LNPENRSPFARDVNEPREKNKESTIVGSFETRRDAEIAVEHLVQEYGIERTDIFIRAPGEANTAGTRPAGADVESGHAGVEKHGSAALKGAVEVSVNCHGDDRTVVERPSGKPA